MAEWLLGLVGVAYLATAIDLYSRGHVGMALAFAGYFIGNIGLILAVRGT